MRFRGQVHSIGALAVRSGRDNYYVRNVPVRIAIEGSDPRLIPDLSAWAEVEVQRENDALVVPREALHTAEGETFVYVKTAGGPQKRPVELGLHTGTRAAVRSGLTEGEEVYLETPK
jgi:cobalt-zinc-cadmium efflux system membrane fusion protein